MRLSANLSKYFLTCTEEARREIVPCAMTLWPTKSEKISMVKSITGVPEALRVNVEYRRLRLTGKPRSCGENTKVLRVYSGKKCSKLSAGRPGVHSTNGKSGWALDREANQTKHGMDATSSQP